MFKIDIPVGAKRIIHLLELEGYRAYVVGGCVRDKMLGRTPHDWDICTSAKPETVCDLLDRYHIRSIKTGMQHGTITALYGMWAYEITTFRIDGVYSDNRRPDDVEFVDNLFEDLARRDFTINAIACDADNSIFDPFDGLSDLHNGIIRCVGHPDDSFREDALRIMRALRFASTYGFKIEEQTAYSIHKNKSLLRKISAERIQSELIKILCGEGVLDILLEYKDVMAVIIPELEPCIGFNQNNPYHIYDVYDHIAHAVAFHKSSDISIKMVLLLHDIGKPNCYTEDEDGIGHFYGHGAISHRLAKDILERLRFDNKTKEEVLTLVLYHDAVINPDNRTVKRWMNKIGPEMLNKLMFVRVADIMAQSEINRESRRDKALGIKCIMKDILAKQQCFTLKDLAINGHDVNDLGIESGPMIGMILSILLDKVIDGEIANDHDLLIGEARRYLKG